MFSTIFKNVIFFKWNENEKCVNDPNQWVTKGFISVITCIL